MKDSKRLSQVFSDEETTQNKEGTVIQDKVDAIIPEAAPALPQARTVRISKGEIVPVLYGNMGVPAGSVIVSFGGVNVVVSADSFPYFFPGLKLSEQ